MEAPKKRKPQHHTGNAKVGEDGLHLAGERFQTPRAVIS